jgi:uncharacterized RDD family membrane protein YckC
MFCKHCGKEIPENSKFCRYCGNRLLSSHKIDAVIEKNIKEGAPGEIEYAGFWIRLGAYVIDFLGMFAGAFAIGLVIGYLFGQKTVDVLPEIFWSYFSYVIYNTFTLSIWSTTFGKYMYGLKVVTETNKPLDFGTALERSLLQPLSAFFFGVGYWNMNKNNKKQAWHDTKATTIVIREKKNLTLAYILTLIAIIIWAYLTSLNK